MPRRRRDNSIDNLPEELRQLVRAMLASKKPRFTYAAIRATVEEKSGGQYRVTDSSLTRYWQGVLEAELMEADRRVAAHLALKDQIDAAISGNPDDVTSAIMGVVDGAILANDDALASIKGADLLDVKARLLRAQAEKDKVRIRERELEAQLQKFQLEKEKAERELAKARAEDERRKAEAERDLRTAESMPAAEREKFILDSMKRAMGLQ